MSTSVSGETEVVLTPDEARDVDARERAYQAAVATLAAAALDAEDARACLTAAEARRAAGAVALRAAERALLDEVRLAAARRGIDPATDPGWEYDAGARAFRRASRRENSAPGDPAPVAPAVARRGR